MSVVQLYTPGIILPLRSHRPPEPFGKPDYKHPKTPGVKDLAPEDVSHLSYNDITFARHPRERHEPSIVPLPSWFPDNQTARVKIEYRLSCTSEGAQVVFCSVLEPSPDAWKKMGHARPKTVVAKIFDPLYYRNTHDMVDAADREYAQEAAAYIHLHGHRMDKNRTYLDKPDIVPGFFGTWTTDVTRAHLRKPFMSLKDKKKTKKKEAYERKVFDDASDSRDEKAKLAPHPFRPVRIILLEYIDGTTLSNLFDRTYDFKDNEVFRFVPEYEDKKRRLQIFHNIMDAGTRVGHFGITHFKRRPSSYIIKKDDRAVLTDFSLADVWDHTDVGYHIQEKLPMPLHPMTLCDIDKWYNFRGWFPPEWLTDVSLYDAWGEATFARNQYTSAEQFDEISEANDWVRTLKRVGRLPYLPGDPEYEESKGMTVGSSDSHHSSLQGESRYLTGIYDDFSEDFVKRLEALAIERGIESPPTTHKASYPIASSSVAPAEPAQVSIDTTQWTNQQTPAPHKGKTAMVNRGTDP